MARPPGTFTITLTKSKSVGQRIRIHDTFEGANDTCTAVCNKLGTTCNQGGLTSLAARYTKSDETYEDLVTNVLKLKTSPVTATTFSTTKSFNISKLGKAVSADVGYFGFGCRYAPFTFPPLFEQWG